MAAVWTASATRGIQAFSPPTQSLPPTIYGMLEDGADHIWLGSKTGIFQVAMAGGAVTAYGTADGMNIRECSGGGHPAAWKLADGSLWFATLDGVSVIDPAHAPQKPAPAPRGDRKDPGQRPGAASGKRTLRSSREPAAWNFNMPA